MNELKTELSNMTKLLSLCSVLMDARLRWVRCLAWCSRRDSRTGNIFGISSSAYPRLRASRRLEVSMIFIRYFFSSRWYSLKAHTRYDAKREIEDIGYIITDAYDKWDKLASTCQFDNCRCYCWSPKTIFADVCYGLILTRASMPRPSHWCTGMDYNES